MKKAGGGALGAFFAKAKKAAPAPASDEGGSRHEPTVRSALDMPLYDGGAAGWDNAPDSDAGDALGGGGGSVAALADAASRVRLHVAELGDDDEEEDDDALNRRIDAEEVQKALAAAKRHAAKAAKKAMSGADAAGAGGSDAGVGAGAAPSSAGAGAAVGGWRAKLEARKKGHAVVDADGWTKVGGAWGRWCVLGGGVQLSV